MITFSEGNSNIQQNGNAFGKLTDVAVVTPNSNVVFSQVKSNPWPDNELSVSFQPSGNIPDNSIQDQPQSSSSSNSNSSSSSGSSNSYSIGSSMGPGLPSSSMIP